MAFKLFLGFLILLLFLLAVLTQFSYLRVSLPHDLRMSIDSSNNVIVSLTVRILGSRFVCRDNIVSHLIEKLIEFPRPFNLVSLELVIEEIEKPSAKRLKVGYI